MKEEELKETLVHSKTVVIVGISPKPDRPSYIVASYLQSKGYRILPVRPEGEEILGEKVHRSLTEIPKEIGIDIVDIFRKPEDVPLLWKKQSREEQRSSGCRKGSSMGEPAIRLNRRG